MADVFEDAKDRIVTAAEWLHRSVCETEGRYNRAAAAGAELAAEVARFLGSPADCGNDALYAAYRRFMGLHSGNFASPTVDEIRKAIAHNQDSSASPGSG